MIDIIKINTESLMLWGFYAIQSKINPKSVIQCILVEIKENSILIVGQFGTLLEIAIEDILKISVDCNISDTRKVLLKEYQKLKTKEDTLKNLIANSKRELEDFRFHLGCVFDELNKS